MDEARGKIRFEMMSAAALEESFSDTPSTSGNDSASGISMPPVTFRGKPLLDGGYYTGPDGTMVFKHPGGATVYLGTDSKLELSLAIENEREMLINILEGNLRVHEPGIAERFRRSAGDAYRRLRHGKAGMKVRIKGAGVVMVIRGTDFIVDVRPDGSATVTVLDGLVELSGPEGGATPISAGQQVEVGSRGAVGTPKSADPREADIAWATTTGFAPILDQRSGGQRVAEGIDRAWRGLSTWFRESWLTIALLAAVYWLVLALDNYSRSSTDHLSMRHGRMLKVIGWCIVLLAVGLLLLFAPPTVLHIAQFGFQVPETLSPGIADEIFPENAALYNLRRSIASVTRTDVILSFWASGIGALFLISGIVFTRRGSRIARRRPWICRKCRKGAWTIRPGRGRDGHDHEYDFVAPPTHLAWRAYFGWRWKPSFSSTLAPSSESTADKLKNTDEAARRGFRDSSKG